MLELSKIKAVYLCKAVPKINSRCSLHHCLR